jgi:EAL domain-containing protein (putative c-di-GMP-specific phosphodiesterase class I)
VAEGIETQTQLDQLRELGCEYGQGYLFSPPVPGDKAEFLLQNQPQWIK